MFKFLIGKIGAKAAIETQRQTVVRAVDELNSVLALMTDRPKVGIDLNSGLLTVDLPDQMPDEALALPAPEEKAAEKGVEDKIENTTSEVVETVSEDKAAA